MLTKNIGIVVVHGIGEQKRLQPLEDIAVNVYTVLQGMENLKNLRRNIRPENFFEPFDFTFSVNSIEYKLAFYSSYWADLDRPYSIGRFLKFLFWVGTLFIQPRQKSNYYYHWIFAGKRDVEKLPEKRMELPKVISSDIIGARANLFLLSYIVPPIMISLSVIAFVISKITGLNLKWIKTLYHYLGDVKLYVNQSTRKDRVETAGLKNHETIRQRFFDALSRATLNNDEVYILSHSLGTVVTFNGLMELDNKIPDLITHPGIRNQLEQQGYLSPEGKFDRPKFLSKLKAVITAGSPLDKFAMIWPRFVPLNLQNPRDEDNPIPWYNIHDVIDIVGANLDYYKDVKGFRLKNYPWYDQKIFLKAHTSYWKEGEKRLINQIISGIISGNINLNLYDGKGLKGKILKISNKIFGFVFVFIIIFSGVMGVIWLLFSFR